MINNRETLVRNQQNLRLNPQIKIQKTIFIANIFQIK